jgi:hypothetical protein
MVDGLFYPYQILFEEKSVAFDNIHTFYSIQDFKFSPDGTERLSLAIDTE